MAAAFCRRRPCHHLLLAWVAWLIAGTPWMDAAAFTNPIAPRGADPWVIQWQGQYFYTHTTGSSVRVWRSPWLEHVNTQGRLVWDPPADTPYGHNLWAPELHRIDGKWYLYVAADDGQDAHHRIYVLEGDSQDPQGSYTLKGQVSIPSDRWAIDGTVMEHNGQHYLVWSARTFSSDSFSSQSLYIAPMSNPWTLAGPRVRISTPTYTWERHGHPVNEGPQILRNDQGQVLLTYSASGFYTPNYAIGVLQLVGDDPLDPAAWVKHPQPLFTAGNGVEGVGHASFVKSPDGTENWIVYHARTGPDAPRDLRIGSFTFGPDGLPQFGQPLPTGQPTANPSGVPLVTFIPNLSFERGGKGWLDDFHVTGDVGAVPNDGERFTPILGSDGPHVGYLGVGVDSGLWQDIGPLHPGVYTFAASLALSDDEADLAQANPADIILQLESIGLYPGGSANEADKVTLAQLVISSDELNAQAFRRFQVTAAIQDVRRVGTWLRVAIYAPTELAAPASRWSVKLDSLSLEYRAALSAPEPGVGIALALNAGWLLARRPRK
ncbi:MAG TPA: glycoside hydrolase family 43 protein [Phycisphaeraceae bacterium]